MKTVLFHLSSLSSNNLTLIQCRTYLEGNNFWRTRFYLLYRNHVAKHKSWPRLNHKIPGSSNAGLLNTQGPVTAGAVSTTGRVCERRQLKTPFCLRCNLVPVCSFNIRELKAHASSPTNKNGVGNCFEGGGSSGGGSSRFSLGVLNEVLQCLSVDKHTTTINIHQNRHQ